MTPISMRSKPIIQWIISAIVIGILIVQWWGEQKRQVDPANAPANAAKSDRSAESVGGRDADFVADDTDSESSQSSGSISSQKPKTPPQQPGLPRVDGLKVHDVLVKNLDGNVVFQGTVDLTKTVERIEAGRVLNEFRHDGVEFKNFERRLPSKPRGHYREWVHPTKDIRGPGPQRAISGKDREMFYTWDHYEHFVKIRSTR